jgi:hypothetical protein
MATHTSNQCDMAVNASSSKCDTALENGSITPHEDTEVQVFQCQGFEGMIESPFCCGEDMSCTV